MPIYIPRYRCRCRYINGYRDNSASGLLFTSSIQLLCLSGYARSTYVTKSFTGASITGYNSGLEGITTVLYQMFTQCHCFIGTLNKRSEETNLFNYSQINWFF